MTTLRQFLGGLTCALCGWMLTACSSEEDSLEIPEGKGLVRIGLSADTGFSTQTKAVDESEYENTANYTIQIWDSKESLVQESKFSEIENPLTLTTGSYTLKAFYGEEYKDKPASKEGFYVEGVTNPPFNVASGGSTSVSVTCKPTSAKVNVVFAEEMATYFDEYYMTFSTNALGSGTKQQVNNGEVYYFLVDNKEPVKAQIALKKKGETAVEFLDRNYTMSPGDAKRINVSPIAPENPGGSLTLKIEVDETVTEVPIDITIPGDWE